MKWKPLKNFEEFYEISEYGEIRSFKRTHETMGRFGKMNRKCGGKILKTHVSNDRYVMTELNTNKKVKKILIHRAVYETFIGELKKGFIIHHKDHDKKNNHYSNLEQMDFDKHNNIHAHEPWNKGIKNPKEMIENARLSREKNYIPLCKEAFELYNQGVNVLEIAKIQNVCGRQIYSRLKRYKEFIK